MAHLVYFIILCARCPNNNCRSLSTLSTSVNGSLCFILMHKVQCEHFIQKKWTKNCIYGLIMIASVIIRSVLFYMPVALLLVIVRMFCFRASFLHTPEYKQHKSTDWVFVKFPPVSHVWAFNSLHEKSKYKHTECVSTTTNRSSIKYLLW